MTQEWKKEFFDALYEKMGEITDDNVLAQNQIGEWYLKTLLAAGEDTDDSVIVQAVTYQAREDVLLMELYVQLTPEFDARAEQEIRAAMDEMNLYLPVGTLGISTLDRSFYLRDCFKLLTDAPMEQAIADAYVDYEMVMEAVTAAYPGLKLIWTGEKTFAEAVEMGLLKKYS